MKKAALCITLVLTLLLVSCGSNTPIQNVKDTKSETLSINIETKQHIEHNAGDIGEPGKESNKPKIKSNITEKHIIEANKNARKSANKHKF